MIAAKLPLIVGRWNFGPITTQHRRRGTVCLVLGDVRSMGAGMACFREVSKGQNGRRDVECCSSGKGGVDVVNAGVVGGRVSPEHLVVMVNGIIGSATDWKFAAEQFVEMLPKTVIVHRSECNSATLTFDGVDLMGERLAEEVLGVVRRWPGLQKISFVAHSLGGLVARYSIGRLYESVKEKNSWSEENSSHQMQSVGGYCKATIAGLEPMNFITFATPHLGSRGNKQLPFLCGLPFLERQASQTAHLVAGRSGKHLFLTDNDYGRPPLLMRMVTDTDGLKFISALRSFKRRVVYANANYDHIVGWRTSSIRRQHELPKVNLLVSDSKYPHILYIEVDTFEGGSHQPVSSTQYQEVDFEEMMIRGLSQVPWVRVHVSFQKSKQRYVAHNTIQVNRYWLNSDGADVIFHMIDNFVL
ncbi:hypothetical protein Droror1_Dr00006782 [Drosera rotundifolia]